MTNTGAPFAVSDELRESDAWARLWAWLCEDEPNTDDAPAESDDEVARDAA
jgi:hypothetical protein